MEAREPALDHIKYNEEEQDVVPDIYREHRHRFSQKPADLFAYKRQLFYRCAHIGTKELEILLGDYLKLNMDKMTYEDVERFDNEIVSIENPSLERYLFKGEQVIPHH